MTEALTPALKLDKAAESKVQLFLPDTFTMEQFSLYESCLTFQSSQIEGIVLRNFSIGTIVSVRVMSRLSSDTSVLPIS